MLDAEIQSVESEVENITTITKTPPPEPVDETFQLARGQSLLRELLIVASPKRRLNRWWLHRSNLATQDDQGRYKI